MDKTQWPTGLGRKQTNKRGDGNVASNDSPAFPRQAEVGLHPATAENNSLPLELSIMRSTRFALQQKLHRLQDEEIAQQKKYLPS